MDQLFEKMTYGEKVDFIISRPTAKERIYFFRQLDEKCGCEEKRHFFTSMGSKERTDYFSQMTAEERKVYLDEGLNKIPRDDITCEDRNLNRLTIFLSGLMEVLKNPAPKKIKELLEFTYEYRTVPYDYCGREKYEGDPEKYKKFLEEFLGKLLQHDGEAWGQILQPLSRNGYYAGVYEKMLSLSPLKGKVVLFVNYAHGRLVGIQSPQIDQLIEKMRKERGLEINYNYGRYLLSLAITEEELEKKLKEMIFAEVYK